MTSTKEHLGHTSDCFSAGSHTERSLANTTSLVIFSCFGKTSSGTSVLGNVKRGKTGEIGIANGYNMLIKSTKTEIPGSSPGPSMRVLLSNNFSAIFKIGLLLYNYFNYYLT